MFVFCLRAPCGRLCVAKSPCCVCNVYLYSVAFLPQSSCLSVCEASARTLVVLGVDGSISSMSRTYTAAIFNFLGVMDLKYKKCAAGELKDVTPVTSVPALVLRFFFFFFFILLGIRVKKLKLHTISFVYQFSSICRTQTLCQPRPSGLVNTMNLPAFFG